MKYRRKCSKNVFTGELTGCELDRVADQVREDLKNSTGVSLNYLWHIICNVDT